MFCCPPGEKLSELSRKNKFVIFVIFYLSGFSSLVYEVLWTKHLSLAFGTTMTAVSIVAATFLAGLAFGSYLLGRISDQSSNLLRIYAGLEMAIVVFALLFTPTLEIVNNLNIFLVEALPNSPIFSHTIHMAASATLLLPPTICMGGTLPLMCRFFARNKSGGQIGRLYAANTFGAALGAFLCGYVLIPGKGLLFTNLLAVSINLIIAATAYVLSKSVVQTSTPERSTKSLRRHLLLAKRYRTVLLTTALIGFFALARVIHPDVDQPLGKRVGVHLGRKLIERSGHDRIVEMGHGRRLAFTIKKRFRDLVCISVGIS